MISFPLHGAVCLGIIKVLKIRCHTVNVTVAFSNLEGVSLCVFLMITTPRSFDVVIVTYRFLPPSQVLLRAVIINFPLEKRFLVDITHKSALAVKPANYAR